VRQGLEFQPTAGHRKIDAILARIGHRIVAQLAFHHLQVAGTVTAGRIRESALEHQSIFLAAMPMHPGAAPPNLGTIPRLKLRTKIVVAGVAVIVAALIIRAATHHGKPVASPDTTGDHGPSLPPADR